MSTYVLAAEVTAEVSAFIAAGAALVGASIGSIGTYLVERVHRRRERREAVYADAVATLGAKVDEFRERITDPRVEDGMSNYDLHHVYFRLKVDGSAEALAAYDTALQLSISFHAATTGRPRVDFVLNEATGAAVPTQESEAAITAFHTNVDKAFGDFETAAEAFERQALADLA